MGVDCGVGAFREGTVGDNESGGFWTLDESDFILIYAPWSTSVLIPGVI